MAATDELRTFDRTIKMESVIVEEVVEESEAARVQAAIAAGQFTNIDQQLHCTETLHIIHNVNSLPSSALTVESLVHGEQTETSLNGEQSQNQKMHVCAMLRMEGRTPTWPNLFDQVLEEEDGIAFAGVCSSLQAALRLKELYEDETVTQYRAKSTVATFGNTEFQRTNLRRATFRLMDVRLYSPIFILAKNRYVCHKGPDIDKGLKERRKKASAAGNNSTTTEDEESPQVANVKEKRKKGHFENGTKSKKPRLCQPTKKVGCPATLTMYEVLITNCEDADFDDELSWKVRIATQEIELQRFIVIFLPHYHEGHAIGQSTASGVSRSWHPDVRSRLTSLLEDGIRDPDEMMRHLKAYVEHNLCVGYVTKPSVDDRRYYPLRTDIRNAMSYDLKEKKITTRTDQDHLALLVQRWASADPDGHCFFRPYGQNEHGEEQTLLLVHQSSNQRYLMLRYGEDAIFLDNTPSYGIPLYLLSVKTNYTYQVVATIWTNVENAKSIAEGLQTIKSWSPDFEPRFAMCEYDDKQFEALQSTWPSTQLLLCDFSREQDWTRWLSREEHGLQRDKSHILGLLRKIANADSEKQFVDAQQRLMSDGFYLNSPQLQAYFGNVYAPIADRWVRWYRQTMRIRADASSANERKMSILRKHQQHTSSGFLSLTCVAETVRQWTEAMWHDYCKTNLTDSSAYKPYDLDDPVKHLANRPYGFRDRQIKSQHNAALFLELCSDIPSYFQRVDVGVFHLKSFTSSSEEHVIDFGSEDVDPYCTCSTFRKHKMPCQHFYAIFAIFEDVSWLSLPASYREMPYFVLDPRCLEVGDLVSRSCTGNELGTDGVQNADSESLRKVNIYRLGGLLDRIKTAAYLVDDRNLGDCIQQVETVVVSVEKAVPDTKLSLILSDTTVSNLQPSSSSCPDNTSLKATSCTIPVIWDPQRQVEGLPASASGTRHVVLSNGDPYAVSASQVIGKRRMPRRSKDSNLAAQREKQKQFGVSLTNLCPESANDPLWVKAGDIVLTTRHQMMLYEELDDTIVAAAMWLLKCEDRDGNFSGLLPPCVIASLQFEGRHAENMVQLIATSSASVGHWVCVSTVDTATGMVEMYDSLVQTGLSVDDLYSHFVKMQVAALLTMPMDQESITVNVMPTVQQNGSLSCGLFAIAFATDLVYYRKVVGAPDQNQLASHLEACLSAGRLTPFPKVGNVDGLVSSQLIALQIPIYCICRLPYSENRDCEEDLMVRCCNNSCTIVWYHLRCAGRSDEERQRAKEYQWYCERCSS